MKKAYLLVYGPSLGTREELEICLNGLAQVLDWRYDLPQSFYILSVESSEKLADLIYETMGRKGRFIIAEVNENSNGYLPKASWYLLRNRQRMPE